MPDLFWDSKDSTHDLLRILLKSSPTDDDNKRAQQLYQELGRQEVERIATINQVDATVSFALTKLLPKGRDQQAWLARSSRNEKRVHKLLAALSEVAEELEGRGCYSAVVEGGGMLLGSDFPEAAFGASDLDLLTAEGADQDVGSAFQAAGFSEVRRRNIPGQRREFCRQDGDHKIWINAGSTSFDRMWAPIPYQNRASVWLSRRVEGSKSTNAYVLHPEDALLFVCVHTSLHGYVRAPGLRLHLDVDRLVRSNSIDWTSFARELVETGVQTRAYFSLKMAADFLETPIPQEILAQLRPSEWRCRLFGRVIGQRLLRAADTPELKFADMIALDIATSETSPIGWLSEVVLPPISWTQERYQSADSPGETSRRLQWRRLRHLVKNRGYSGVAE